MRRTLVLLVTLTLATIAPGAARAAETHQVFMSAFRFCNDVPACAASENTTIAVGDTVEWIFADPACVALHALGCFHTATRSTGTQQFDSGAMPGASPTLGAPAPKMTFSRTFNVAGTYEYVCVLHVSNFSMRATIVVNP